MKIGKLGKLPARIDKRTFRLSKLLPVKLPPIPDSWDYDTNCKLAIPTPMFGNDIWGDCVIAGRAHLTLRFETSEQNRVIDIEDKDVLREYWQEGGATPCHRHPDNGLFMLTSLKSWRNKGWKINGGKKYNIFAFAKITPWNYGEVKAAIFLLTGAYVGLALPNSAKSQQVWDVDYGEAGTPGSWGGHCVTIAQYDANTLTCVTWGGKQKMTWAFFRKYCDEAYAIVDNRNAFMTTSPINVELLKRYLDALGMT